MKIKKLLGTRILVNQTNGEYNFSEQESGLLIPKGYDLNLGYSEGEVIGVSDKSICKVGDRVVYLDHTTVESSDGLIVDDSSIVLIERD